MNSNPITNHHEQPDPDRRRLLEALEACRPGSDDFERLLDADTVAAVRADSELTLRYERLQKFDAAVADAFADVPVPVDLQARLRAALAADALVSAAEIAETSPEASLSGHTASASPAGNVSPAIPAPTQAASDGASSAPVTRRRWLAACGAAAAATAAGLAGFWFLREGPPVEFALEQLLDEAAALHGRPEDTLGPAESFDFTQLPADFPLSRALVRPAEVRRRKIDLRLAARPGVAYELAPVGRPRATLYVLAERPAAPIIVGLAQGHSGHADKSTGNLALGAWREGDLTYVLVVEGDRNRFRRFFTAAGGVYA